MKRSRSCVLIRLVPAFRVYTIMETETQAWAESVSKIYTTFDDAQRRAKELHAQHNGEEAFGVLPCAAAGESLLLTD